MENTDPRNTGEFSGEIQNQEHEVWENGVHEGEPEKGDDGDESIEKDAMINSNEKNPEEYIWMQTIEENIPEASGKLEKKGETQSYKTKDVNGKLRIF